MKKNKKLSLNKKVVGLIGSNSPKQIKGGTGTTTTLTTSAQNCDSYPSHICTLHFCRHSEEWQGNKC